jgi:tetratricopeptide (TPR) repeat protein
MKCAFAHYNGGNILMVHGQFLQAITLFDRVLEINPRDEAALTILFFFFAFNLAQ